MSIELSEVTVDVGAQDGEKEIRVSELPENGLELTLERRDITMSKRGCPFLCPVANALTRQFPGSGFWVGKDTIHFMDDEHDIEQGIPMSLALQSYVKSFDNGGIMKPGKLILTPELLYYIPN